MRARGWGGGAGRFQRNNDLSLHGMNRLGGGRETKRFQEWL